MSDSIDLRDVSSSSDSDSDVKILEFLEAEKKDGLEDLNSKGLWLEEFDGGTVDSEDSLACSDGGNSD